MKTMIVALVALMLVGCGGPRVERVDPGTVLDYQGAFDEDDAREVARALIPDALNRPWIDVWNARHGRAPVVIVGDLRNNTSDYIEQLLITKSLERELLNSGRVSIVAAADEREQLRAERRQGQDWSRPETVKKMAYELGADLMVLGSVAENVESTPNRAREIQYYQVSLEMVDIESNEKVWIGTHEIEKRVSK